MSFAEAARFLTWIFVWCPTLLALGILSILWYANKTNGKKK